MAKSLHERIKYRLMRALRAFFFIILHRKVKMAKNPALAWCLFTNAEINSIFFFEIFQCFAREFMTYIIALRWIWVSVWVPVLSYYSVLSRILGNIVSLWKIINKYYSHWWLSNLWNSNFQAPFSYFGTIFYRYRTRFQNSNCHLNDKSSQLFDILFHCGLLLSYAVV